MTGDDLIKSLLSLLAWRDGHENGVNGMLGVMFAARNRIQNGDWMAAICELLGGEIPRAGIDVREPAFQQVLQLADSVYDGSAVDRLTGGATDYADYMSNPDVYSTPRLERTAKIGTLNFFRWSKTDAHV